MSTGYKVNNGNYTTNTDLIKILPVCEFLEADINFNNSDPTNSGTIILNLYKNTTNYNVYTSYYWISGTGGTNIFNASNSLPPSFIYNKTEGQFNWMVFRNNTGYDWTGKLKFVVVYY